MRTIRVEIGTSISESARYVLIQGAGSVSPARHVAVGRSCLEDSLDDPICIHLMVTQPGKRNGPGRIAVPAMFVAATVGDFATEERVLGRVEEVLDEVHGVVEVEIVGLADVEVDLAFKVLADLRPVATEDLREVVMIAPMNGDGRVDDAGPLVPDPLGIAIIADGREDGLPDVPLLAGSPLGARGPARVGSCLRESR